MNGGKAEICKRKSRIITVGYDDVRKVWKEDFTEGWVAFDVRFNDPRSGSFFGKRKPKKKVQQW